MRLERSLTATTGLGRVGRDVVDAEFMQGPADLRQILLGDFAASLAGKGAPAPSSIDANKPLDAMIAGINTGMIQQYLVFDKQGGILSLTANDEG